jgi:hypothetical protein
VVVFIVEREVLCGERSLCCKIFSWVHREGREEEKERDICKIKAEIELYSFIVNKLKLAKSKPLNLRI